MYGHVNVSMEMPGRNRQYVCVPTGLLENIYPAGWLLRDPPAPPCTEYLWEPVHFSEHAREF